NIQLFEAKPWPPTVTKKPDKTEVLLKGEHAEPQTVHLYEAAEHPFLFWRTAVELSAPPKADAVRTDPDVRAEGEHAWRLDRARKLIHKHGKGVTDELVNSEKAPNPDIWQAVRKAAQGEKEKLIILRNVAPLVKRPGNERRTEYVPYELPRGTILYPGE